MDRSSFDLLALLGGSSVPPAPPPEVQSPVTVNNAGDFSPPRAATSPAASHTNSLLDLLSAVPPPVVKKPLSHEQAAVSNGNDLLAQLFGPSYAKPTPPPQVDRPPSGAQPVLRRGVSPDPQPVAVDAVPNLNTKSPFDFHSPFDLLAKGPPKAAALRAISQPVPSTSALPSTQRREASPAMRQSSSPAVASDTLKMGGEVPAVASSKPPEIPTSAPQTPLDAAVEQLPGDSASITAHRRKLHGEERVSLRLDTSRIDLKESTLPVEITAVTRSPSAVHYVEGQTLALAGGAIVFGGKAGRIRVLDRATGARMLLRLHKEALIDIQAAPVSIGGWTTVATCARDGKLIMWRIPTAFDQESARHEVLAEIIAASATRFAKLRWSPDGSRLAVITAEGRLVVIDLRSSEWKHTLAKGTSIPELQALRGQPTLQPDRYIGVDFSPDGTEVAVIRNSLDQDNGASLVLFEYRPPIFKWAAIFNFEPSLGPATSVVCCGRGIYAVSFDNGRLVKVVSIASSSIQRPANQLSLRIGSDDQQSEFSRLHWISSTSTLTVGHSSGHIFLIKVDTSTLEFVSVGRLSSSEPLIDVVMKSGESSVFCTLASGICQLHIHEQAVQEASSDDDMISDTLEVKSESIVTSADKADLIAKRMDVQNLTSPPLVTAASAQLSPTTTSHGGTHQEIRSHETLLTEVERLLGEFSRLQEVRWADDRTAELERQEEVLRTVSATLTQNTSRAVDASVRQAIQSSVIPALHTSLQDAVNKEFLDSVSQSIQQFLPAAVEKLFQKPEIVNSLAKQITYSAKSAIHETVTSLVTAQLASGLQASAAQMFQRLTDDVRSEMVDIRKTIVAEQSSLLEILVSKIEALEARLAVEPSLVHPKTATVSNKELLPMQPTRAYADTLLTVLESRDHTQLGHFIQSSSPQQVHALFSRPSPIALAEVLVLIYMLGDSVHSAPVPLSSDAANRLHWLKRACGVIDRHNSEPRAVNLLPEVLGRCRTQFLLPLLANSSRIGDVGGAALVEEAVRAVQDALHRP